MQKWKILILDLEIFMAKKFLVGVYGHNNTESCHQGNDRCATVADQWQRQAHDGQQTDDHADVDEGIQEEGQAETAREQAGKGVLPVDGNIQATTDHKQVYGQ